MGHLKCKPCECQMHWHINHWFVSAKRNRREVVIKLTDVTISITKQQRINNNKISCYDVVSRFFTIRFLFTYLNNVSKTMNNYIGKCPIT